MGIRREPQASVGFRNDHSEEAFVLDVLPRLRREIMQFGRHLPVIDQGARRLDFIIHERLLFRRQLRNRQIQQALPVWITAEEFPLPPDRPSLECIPLGFRHLGQNAFICLERRPRNQGLAQ